jgi:hypothetical protein
VKNARDDNLFGVDPVLKDVGSLAESNGKFSLAFSRDRPPAFRKLSQGFDGLVDEIGCSQSGFRVLVGEEIYHSHEIAVAGRG